MDYIISPSLIKEKDAIQSQHVEQDKNKAFSYPFRLIILQYNRLINMNMTTTPNQNSHASSISAHQMCLCPPTLDDEHQDQLPGVKEVLMNSLRINKKLHGEIVAKEHSVRNEAQQANLKLNSLYRDMEEVYAKTQQLYEETVRQNQKTRFMAEQLLKPFRDELRGKVDETTLSLKMKMMLSEFDNLGHKISYDKQGKQIEDDDNHTFRFVRTQILPIVSRLEHDIKQANLSTQRQQQELSALHIRQEDLTKDLLKSRQMAFEMKTSLIDQINSKVSDEVWDYRLNNFYQSYIRNSINTLAHTITKTFKEATTEITDVKLQVDLLKKNNYDLRINDNVKKIEELKLEIAKIGKSNANHESLVGQLKKSIDDNKVALQRQITLATQNSNKEQISHLLEENMSMKEQFEAITSKLQLQLQNAIQNNEKGLFYKVSRLESQVKILAQHANNTLKLLNNDQHEIAYIKDLLAKKANFTDIIVHTQNKADKQDYQELKHLIQSNANSNACVEPELEESCMITQEEPREEITPPPNRFRKRQSTSGRKNQQHSVSPFVADSDRDDSVKRYMLGLKNGSNYTRENLLKQKTRFMFLNQTERRQPKNTRRGETFTQNFA